MKEQLTLHITAVGAYLNGQPINLKKERKTISAMIKNAVCFNKSSVSVGPQVS